MATSDPARSMPFIEFPLSSHRPVRIVVELDDGTRLTFPVIEPPGWDAIGVDRTLRLEASSTSRRDPEDSW